MKPYVPVFCLVLLFFSCDLFQKLPERNFLLKVDVSPPGVSPLPAVYEAGESITLTAMDKETMIFYTLDGSEPDLTHFDGAGKGEVVIPQIGENCILNAFSMKNNCRSDLVSLDFQVREELYLQEDGHRWIILFSDKRYYKYDGINVDVGKATISTASVLFQNTGETGNFKDGKLILNLIPYSKYSDELMLSDLIKRDWQSVSKEEIYLEKVGKYHIGGNSGNFKTYSSFLLLDDNRILYQQNAVLLVNGVGIREAYHRKAVEYYPGVGAAGGRAVVLYEDDTFLYYNGFTRLENTYQLENNTIALHTVATGKVSNSRLEFGSLFYEPSIDSFVSPLEIVGFVWKYGSWTIQFTTGGTYTFTQESSVVKGRYFSYGKFFVLEKISGIFVYRANREELVFINTKDSRLVYTK